MALQRQEHSPKRDPRELGSKLPPGTKRIKYTKDGRRQAFEFPRPIKMKEFDRDQYPRNVRKTDEEGSPAQSARQSSPRILRHRRKKH